LTEIEVAEEDLIDAEMILYGPF